MFPKGVHTWLLLALTMLAAGPAPGQTIYQASTDFSNQQGYRGWSYLESNGKPMAFDTSNGGRWKGSEEYSLLMAWGGHPGNAIDVVRRWTAPQAGTARLTGTAKDGDLSGGDGVVIIVRKGTQTLWQQAVANGDTAGKGFDLSVAVAAGESVDFVINKGAANNWWDSTVFDPKVAFTVAAASPSGTISASPNPCSIPAGQASCTATVSWSATNAPFACILLKETGQSFACGTSGSQAAPWIAATPITFELRASNSMSAQFLASVQVKGTAPSATNGAQFVSWTVPASVTAGQTFQVSMTMKNTGTKAWDGSYRLGDVNAVTAPYPWKEHRMYLPAAVQPGQTATFTTTLTAPASAGNYPFRWRMVQELVEWFGDHTPLLNVTVSAPAAKVTAVASTPDKASPRPASTAITWTASATGGASPQYRFWTKAPGGDYAVARDYSSDPRFVWTPQAAGRWEVCTWARSAGSTADYEAFQCPVYYDITAPQPAGDTSPPTVTITSPTNGSTVSGAVNVSANASDNVGVSKVEFYVDGSLKFTDTAAPWGFSEDSALLPNGSHTLLAKAYDAAGNMGQHQITATVSNTAPPPPPGGTCGQVGTNAFYACYYDNMDFTSLKVTRTEPKVDFDWGTGSPDPLIGPDTFSARWEGDFAFEAGTYEFSATVDDGIRVSVDGAAVIDSWKDQPPTPYKGSKTLTAGTHRVKVEYYENGGGATARVAWAKTGTAPAANGAQFVSQSVPASVTAGQTFSVSVTMKNSGTKAWDGNYRLGDVNAVSAPYPWKEHRMYLPATVQPGQTYTFTATLMAPATPGGYPFQWRMVQELVEWFGDHTPLLNVTVSAPAAKVTAVASTPDKASPQPANAAVTWTASAAGGTSPQYRFWTKAPGGDYAVARDYSSDPRFVWTPQAAGRWEVCTWARSAGSTADYEAYQCPVFYDVTTSQPTGDTTNPTVTITAPVNGATVSGAVSIAANAADNVGVAKVEFYVDGSLAFTDVSAPYGFSEDSAKLSNGGHTLLAKAYDAAGNFGQHQITATVSNAVPPPSLPPPSGTPLDGTFLHAPTLAAADISRVIDELRSLGMTIAILDASRVITGGCTGAFAWRPDFPGRLGGILDEAQARGIQVYVGLVMTLDVCGSFYSEPTASRIVQDTDATVQQLQAAYGSHPALAGWYIPDEPALTAWTDPGLTYGYYRGLVTAIRKHSAKPILVAPYLGGVGTKTPAEVASRALAFKNNTDVTIQVWQDSVGADALNLGWSRGGYTLGDYLAAIAGAIGKASLWSDNELFNCCTFAGFKGGIYHPASASRLSVQLQASAAADRKVAWLQQRHMGTVESARYPGAERLLAAYKATSGLSSQTRLIPASYSWVTPPASQYPDEGNTLFDGKTADPKSYLDKGWAGVLGNAELRVDLGAQRLVDWVGVHVLNQNSPAVKFPDSLRVRCSADDVSWAEAGSWNLSVAKEDGEFVLANAQPMGSSCRYLRVLLANTAWTFLSELELTGSAPSAPPPAPVAANGAQFVSQNVPASVPAGQTFQASVTMKNTGTKAWDGNYRLGDVNAVSAPYPWKEHRMYIPMTVQPGQTYTFTGTLTAPAAAGTYPFRWSMVQELVEWFGDHTPLVDVTVQAADTPPPPSGQLPPAVVFTRAYRGAKTANLNRRVEWRPGEGGGPAQQYWVAPSWGAGFLTAATAFDFSEKPLYQGGEQPLADGAYTISVQAVNSAGKGPAAVDTVVIARTNPANPPPYHAVYGVANVSPRFDPGAEVADAVGLRFRLRVQQAAHASAALKLIFGAARLYAPGGADTYLLETNLYTDRYAYADPTCATWPLQGARTAGSTSLRVAVPDYPKKGKTGAKTLSAAAFPRQSYLIDGIAGLGKTDMISQLPVEGKDILVEISRGGLIADKTGWKCGGAPLDADAYRQWDVAVTMDGTRHAMAFALPDSAARYLAPNELFNIRTEFMHTLGYFKAYYWDFAARRESGAWVPLTRWAATETDGYPVDFGAKLAAHNGLTVLEVSNEAPGAYLAVGQTVSLSDPVPPPPAPPPGDTSAPTVAITSPANGSTVSGTVNVSANVSDNVGVTKVDFYVDGSLKFTDTAAPWGFSEDSALLPNGSHTLLVKAYDAAGNMGQHQITATVSNTAPPPPPGGTCGQVGTNAFYACYYDNMDFTSLKVTRTEPKVDFDWGTGSPDPLIGPDTFSARWEGDFAFEAGTYEFSATVDDGIRVSVDGAAVIDSWKDQPPTPYKGSKTLTAGTHRVKVEYYENGGGAVARVAWAKSAPPGVKTYYVATSGSDSNPGTAAAPFRTIQKAADLVGPGDTVIVKPGVYSETTERDGLRWGVYVTRSGTPEAWITFKSETKWGAVLDGGDPATAGHSGVRTAGGVGYVRFEGFEVRNWESSGFSTYENDHHIHYLRNNVHRIGAFCTDTEYGKTGFSSKATAHDLHYEGNLVHHIGRLRPSDGCVYATGFWQNHDHGMYLYADQVSIINNVFHDIPGGWAIQTGNEGVSGWRILNNTFAFPNPNRPGHIMLWGDASDVLIQNNLFYRPLDYAVALLPDTGKSGVAIRNNLVDGGGLLAPTPGNPGGYAVQANVTGADARLNSPSAGDFGLAVLSPARDAGAASTEVTADFAGAPRPQGPAYDIGAFEAVPAAPPAAANGAQFVFWSVPAGVTAGQTFNVSVTMKNSGTKAWDGNYRLGDVNASAEPYPWKEHRMHLSGAVQPGQAYTFTATLTAPASAGSYPFRWRMVQESVEWFGEKTPALTIDVTAPSQPPPADPPIALTTDPKYLVINVAYPAGSWDDKALGGTPKTDWDAADWDRVPLQTLAEMRQKIGSTGGGDLRLAFSWTGLWEMDRPVDETIDRIDKLFALARRADLPVFISLAELMYWGSRPELWNWFDPARPGYDPRNIDNVEWSCFDPACASKDSWRNWGGGSGFWNRFPAPNYESPVIRADIAARLGRIVPAIKRNVRALQQEGKEHLFAGVRIGWEGSLSTNFSCGQETLDRQETCYGYRSYMSRKCPGGGDCLGGAAKPADFNPALVETVQRYLEFLAKTCVDAGLPKDRLYVQALMLWENGKLSYVPAAFNSYSRATWSIYPPNDDVDVHLRPELQARGFPAWGAGETNIWRMDDKAAWLRHLKSVLDNPGTPNGRMADILNWESPSVKDSPATLAAIRELLNGAPPAPAPPTGNVYQASADFSSTQGQRGWSYLESGGKPMAFDSSEGGRWKGSEQYSLLTAWGGHPGEGVDVVRRWTASQAGTARVSGTAKDGDVSGGDGVVVIVRKGTQELWRQAVANGDTTGKSFDLGVSLAAGDALDFVINRGPADNRWDSTTLDPKVEFTPATAAAPACGQVGTSAFYACYYDNMDFTSLKVTRTEPKVDFDWGTGSPDPLIGPDTFSARWEGDFAFEAGTYEFSATVDDGIRVLVDGVVVIESWKDQAPTLYKGSKTLTAGTHRVKVEYYENGGGATAKVAWEKAGGTAPSPVVNAPSTAAQWRVTELAFTAQFDHPDPFRGPLLSAVFTGPGGQTLTVPGFWDGGRTWKVRFTPTVPGPWSYATTLAGATDPGLHGKTGSFTAAPASGDNPFYARGGFLKISPNKRYLTYSDGAPFFWLGDTWWHVPSPLVPFEGSSNPQYASMFKTLVDLRKQQGFSVLQWAFLGNAKDPVSLPNDVAFWQNADRYFQYANDAGLLPAVAANWFPVLDQYSLDQLKAFWRQMVARYGAYACTWLIVGEYNVLPMSPERLAKLKALGQYIKDIDPYKRAMTVHPWWFEKDGRDVWEESWYDFIALQGAHQPGFAPTRIYADAYRRAAPKPVLESEANYEGILGMTTEQTRRAAYRAVQSGSFGYTYGAHGLWYPTQNEGDATFQADWGRSDPWWAAMNKPGATEMSHLRALYESVPWWKLEPRPEAVSAAAALSEAGKVLVKADGGETVLVYFPKGTPASLGVSLSLGDPGRTYAGTWFNPRAGTSSSAGQALALPGTLPARPDAEDWMLVLRAGGQAPPALACGQPAVNAFTACYYDNMDFTNPKVTRTEPKVDFDWGAGSPDPLIGPDTFSARWEGDFQFEAGTYEFTATVDDGIRVWVDGALVLESWEDQPPTSYRGSKALTAGTHRVKVEYYENGGGAAARVAWAKAAMAPTATSASPSQVTAGQDTTVSLSGANFQPGAVVTVSPSGGSAGTASARLAAAPAGTASGELQGQTVSNSLLQVRLGAGLTPGSYALGVRNPDGRWSSQSVVVSALAAPAPPAAAAAPAPPPPPAVPATPTPHTAPMAALRLVREGALEQAGLLFTFTGTLDARQAAFPAGASLQLAFAERVEVERLELDGRTLAASEFARNGPTVRIPFPAALYLGQHTLKVTLRNAVPDGVSMDRLVSLWMSVVDGENVLVVKGRTAGLIVKGAVPAELGRGVRLRLAPKCQPGDEYCFETTRLLAGHDEVALGRVTPPDAVRPPHVAYTLGTEENSLALGLTLHSFSEPVAREFVEAHYLHLLGREPSAAELTRYLPLFTGWRNPVADLLDVLARRADVRKRVDWNGSVDWDALLAWARTEGWREEPVLASFKQQDAPAAGRAALAAVHDAGPYPGCGNNYEPYCPPASAANAICGSGGGFGFDACWADAEKRHRLVLWAKDEGWRKHAGLAPHFKPGAYPEHAQERAWRWPPATLHHELRESAEFKTGLQARFRKNIDALYRFLLDRPAGEADLAWANQRLRSDGRDWASADWLPNLRVDLDYVNDPATGEPLPSTGGGYYLHPVYGIRNFPLEADVISTRLLQILEQESAELRQGESFKRIVTGLYRLYLRRTPTDAEVESWRGKKFGDVELGINQSAEYAANPASQAAIRSVFRNYLGRDPESYSEWSGQTIEQVVKTVGNSAELKALAREHPENAYVFPLPKVKIVKDSFFGSSIFKVIAAVVGFVAVPIVAAVPALTALSATVGGAVGMSGATLTALTSAGGIVLSGGMAFGESISRSGSVAATSLSLFGILAQSVNGAFSTTGFTGKAFIEHASAARGIIGQSGGVYNPMQLLDSADPLALANLRTTADAAFVSATVPGSMSPGTAGTAGVASARPMASGSGRAYLVSLSFKNTGDVSWDEDYALVLESTRGWSAARLPLARGERVEPGAVKHFVFYVAAPSEAGDYPFRWRMRRGEEPFGEASPAQTIQVRAPTRPDPALQRAATSLGKTAQDSGVPVTLHGTGFATGAKVIYRGPRSGVALAEVLDSRTLRFTLPLAAREGAQTAAVAEGGSYEVAVQNPGGEQSAVMTLEVGTETAGPGAFGLGKVYAYPNPATRQKKATFHVETKGAADEVVIRVYDVAGDKVAQVTLPGGAGVSSGGTTAYEHQWDDGGLASGVYLYVVEAKRASQTVKAKGKLALVR